MNYIFFEAGVSCMLYYGTYLATIRNKYENDVIFNMTSNYAIAIGSNCTLIGYFSKNGNNDNNNNIFGIMYMMTMIMKIVIGVLHNHMIMIVVMKIVFLLYIIIMVVNGMIYHVIVEKSIGVCDSPYYNDGEFIEVSLGYISIHICSNWDNTPFLQSILILLLKIVVVIVIIILLLIHLNHYHYQVNGKHMY